MRAGALHEGQGKECEASACSASSGLPLPLKVRLLFPPGSGGHLAAEGTSPLSVFRAALAETGHEGGQSDLPASAGFLLKLLQIKTCQGAVFRGSVSSAPSEDGPGLSGGGPQLWSPQGRGHPSFPLPLFHPPLSPTIPPSTCRGRKNYFLSILLSPWLGTKRKLMSEKRTSSLTCVAHVHPGESESVSERA